MKFMIAGLGSIGRRHLRNLLALGETDILLFRTHQATMPDEELRGFPVFTELGAALAQKPDGVIISNPTAAHMGVALPAARAGCNLLIEKPISHNLEGLQALRAELDRHQKQAQVGFHFRYHPVLRLIKQILEKGDLGRTLSAEAHWGEYLPGWHPWEDYRASYAARADLGGGVTLTLSHPFDYLRWLLGEVAWLSAATARASDLGIEAEDRSDINLCFTSAASAQVHLDYYQRPAAHWLEITCTNGFIRWENASGTAVVTNALTGSQETLVPPPGFERNSMFLEEMSHFIRLCRGETDAECGLEDGVRALEIALAVHQSSAKENRRVYLAERT